VAWDSKPYPSNVGSHVLVMRVIKLGTASRFVVTIIKVGLPDGHHPQSVSKPTFWKAAAWPLGTTTPTSFANLS
jgi:hypothetical protein